MVLDSKLWEEIDTCQREAVLPGWEVSEIPSLHDLLCGVWASRPPRHLERLQMRLIVSDFDVDIQQLSHEIVRRVRDVAFPAVTNLWQLCQGYVERVRTIGIVRKVLLIETEDIPTIWTIIDALPFEDSLRQPIYEAQLHVLRALEATTRLDFYVLNVSELPEGEQLTHIVPSGGKLLLER